MNKYANKILKYLNKFSTDDEPIDVFKIFKDFNVDEETLTDVLNFLERKVLIKSFKHYYDNKILSSVFYSSTTLGREYFKTKFKNKLFNAVRIIFLNIICPLLVAYITALITANNIISNNNCCNKSSQTTDK